MSIWAEEILTDLHNVGLDEGPSWKDMKEELPDFTWAQLSHLQGQLRRLQACVRYAKKGAQQ